MHQNVSLLDKTKWAVILLDKIPTRGLVMGAEAETLRETSLRLEYEAAQIELTDLVEAYITDTVILEKFAKAIDRMVMAAGHTGVWIGEGN